MSVPPDRVRVVWFRALVVGGATLALTMLVQTVIGYRYITGNLLLQEGRREGERIARQIEQAVRSGDPREATTLSSAVDAVWRGLPTQAAWIVVVDDQNEVVAARGRERSSFTPSDRQKALEAPEPTVRFQHETDSTVIVGVFPCRCAPAPQRRRARAEGIWNVSYDQRPPPPQVRGPMMIEVALYPEKLSAPFSRVRRMAAIDALTACALLASMIALGFRFRGYIRSRQMEAQLDAARRVQRELMPVSDARIPGVELAADCTPASHVGGDLVDVLHLPGGRLGFMLGDVSGKGLSAALLMGLVQGAMTASGAELGGDAPEQAVARVNDLLVEKTSGDRFFWCSFDPADATLRYVNAGHPPAFLVRRGRPVEPLTDGGPVFGVIPGAPYRSGRATVAPGDLLVVFSDGIAEAANRQDEEFGADRIAQAVQAHATSSARGICDAVLSDVERFAGAHGARDDRTLLVVRFTIGCAAFSTGRALSAA